MPQPLRRGLGGRGWQECVELDEGYALVVTAAFSDSASCPSMRAMAIGGGHGDDSMASSFFSVDSVTGMGEGFDNHSSSLSSSTRRGNNVAVPAGLDYGAYE